MSRNPGPTLPEAGAIDDVAADWLLQSSQPDFSPAQAQALADWLDAAPAHRAAYDNLAALMQDLRRIPRIHLEPDTQAQPHPRPRKTRHAGVLRLRQLLLPTSPTRRPLFACMAFSFLVTAIAGYIWHQYEYPQFQASYATGVGEQERIVLPDGSVIVLDSATRLTATTYARHRKIVLEDGQAWFEVVPDPARPFTVRTPVLQATVLGTQFAVRYSTTGVAPGRAGVAVATGKVAVAPTRTWWPDWPWITPAGDTLTTGMRASLAPGQSRLTFSRIAPESIANWRHGRITFEDTPLTQAIEEFQRYAPVQVTVASTAVSSLRIGGSFNSKDFDNFAHLLPRMLPVQLRQTDQGLEIRSR
ncbi:FecR domain-containing protein [Kerstersia gyiorum]|uniref:FecR family protein n=1 Tax=Kerstersia gyiorum TaxID=206506 RepID=UPI00214F8A11|nr:FecR domain-containing protein [Kerstersia gyiorum]MCR4157549.1 FecR domain-containing protein [Kerstersia gyiorum]